MPSKSRYTVTVQYPYKKEINVFAHSEDEAKEMAVDKVLAWDKVVDAEATNCERDFRT